MPQRKIEARLSGLWVADDLKHPRGSEGLCWPWRKVRLQGDFAAIHDDHGTLMVSVEMPIDQRSTIKRAWMRARLRLLMAGVATPSWSEPGETVQQTPVRKRRLAAIVSVGAGLAMTAGAWWLLQLSRAPGLSGSAESWLFWILAAVLSVMTISLWVGGIWGLRVNVRCVIVRPHGCEFEFVEGRRVRVRWHSMCYEGWFLGVYTIRLRGGEVVRLDSIEAFALSLWARLQRTSRLRRMEATLGTLAILLPFAGAGAYVAAWSWQERASIVDAILGFVLAAAVPPTALWAAICWVRWHERAATRRRRQTRTGSKRIDRSE